MGYTSHTTKSGRTVIETDGRSEFYGNALVQGNIIARFSVPSNMIPDAAIAALRSGNCHRCKNAGPDYIDSIRDAVPGIRVFSWKIVG